MKLNRSDKNTKLRTREGATGHRMTPLQALRRSVMSCFLWEKEFYEDGEEISERIASLAKMVKITDLVDLAIEARHTAYLRHVPLLLLSVMAERAPGKNSPVAETIERVISRADEMGELLAVHAKRHKLDTTDPRFRRTISKQMKLGLAAAFANFNEYQLSKYNGRNQAIKLRDIMRLVHPKPANEDQNELYRRVLADELVTADTWETALSNTPRESHRGEWERLLKENKLGYMALLRNLRNMSAVGVDRGLVRKAILARRGAGYVLPFRYIAASAAAPEYELELDQAMMACELPELEGETIYLIDVSGSMTVPVSARSVVSRMVAAATLASIVRGPKKVFTFSDRIVEVVPRMGKAGVDAIIRSQTSSGTQLGAAVRAITQSFPKSRLIVITDEQSHDTVPYPVNDRSYMINVGSNKVGVSYGRWKHIDGFSENTVRWIQEVESNRED